MTLKRLVGVVFLLAMLLFSACSNYFYSPTRQTVLNFQDKGDVALQGMIDGNDALGASVGYALSNHVAVNSDLKYFGREHGSSYKFDNYVLDNELIYFHKIPAERGHIIPAINAGYGFGELGRNTNYYGISLQRQFLQPSIGYVGLRGLEAAFSFRATRINYDVRQLVDWETNNPYRPFQEAFGLPDDNNPYLFIEPALTLGYGYRAVRLRVQASWASAITKVDYDYLRSALSVSLNVNLNARRKKPGE